MLAAGDRLLVMGGTGELIIAKANPAKFEELSRVKLFEEGKTSKRFLEEMKEMGEAYAEAYAELAK